MVCELSDTYKLQNFDSLDGMQIKWCVPTQGSCIWYKSDGNSYAGLSEELCSLLAGCITDVFPYVKYTSCYIKSETIRDRGCFSRNFSDNKIEKDFYTIIESKYRTIEEYERLLRFSSLEDRFKTIVDIIYTNYNVDITLPFARLLLFDAIVLNSDRHLHNLSLLITEDTVEMSPCFDNGAALCSNLVEFPLGNQIDFYNIHPKSIGGNFEIQVKTALKFCQPLSINANKAYKKLEEYSPECYSVQIIDRATKMLHAQLDKWKDIAWVNTTLVEPTNIFDV